MKISRRTFHCRTCRKFTRLLLPTEQRFCSHCGASLMPPYTEGDFADVNDPAVIGNWLTITKARYFGLEPARRNGGA